MHPSLPGTPALTHAPVTAGASGTSVSSRCTTASTTPTSGECYLLLCLPLSLRFLRLFGEPTSCCMGHDMPACTKGWPDSRQPLPRYCPMQLWPEHDSAPCCPLAGACPSAAADPPAATACSSSGSSGTRRLFAAPGQQQRRQQLCHLQSPVVWRLSQRRLQRIFASYPRRLTWNNMTPLTCSMQQL